MFKILLNNLIYSNYKVFISPFNSKIWGDFNSTNKNAINVIDITFRPLPEVPVEIPKRDAKFK